MERELSVVIPTFNERENLLILIPNVLEVFRTNQIDGEIIIVDDRSSDGSFEFLNEQKLLIPSLKVIFREPPASISRAWHEGFDAASKKIIVCIDADLCHDPIYFSLMLTKMEDYDIFIGSRYFYKSKIIMKEKSFIARLASFVGQYVNRSILGFIETDTSHSFRMFKKVVFDSIKERLNQEGNVFLIQFLYYAEQSGYKVTEIPIIYGKRIFGKTKLKVIKEGLRYLRFITLLLFRRIISF